MKTQMQYNRSTQLRDEGNGKWSVYDVLNWQSGNVEEIKRFEGNQTDATNHYNKLVAYWKNLTEKLEKDKI